MKIRTYSISFLMLLIGIISVQTAFADVKIKTRRTMSGQTYEGASYIKGKRQRHEQNMGGMESVSITQCDLKRSLQLVPQTKSYMVQNWEVAESKTPTTTVTNTKVPSQKGGVVNVINTIKDTGERKQMFGYTARHLIITMEMESSPDACNKTKMKMQTDGWYIDFGTEMDCDYGYAGGGYGAGQNGGCQDRYVTKNLGTGKRGFALYEKTTMFDESGKETYTMMMEVVELSKATLDASLFDAPADYKQVQDSSALYSGMGAQAINNARSENGENESNSAMNSSVQNLANKTPEAPTELGAKKEGVIRIGLDVKAGKLAEGLKPDEVAGAVQNSLAENLKNSQIEVVVLENKDATAMFAEAKEKECDYILSQTVSHKKGGGGFGGMLKKAAPVLSSVMPIASTVGGIVASSAIYTAASLAGNVKSKDEMNFDVNLQKIDGTSALAKQFKQKAKSDGEDIISPASQQIAQAVAETVNKK